jgi:hypothetical protein
MIGKALGPSQNAGPDLAIASSWALYFENAPTLGLYPTQNSHSMLNSFQLENMVK